MRSLHNTQTHATHTHSTHHAPLVPVFCFFFSNIDVSTAEFFNSTIYILFDVSKLWICWREMRNHIVSRPQS